MQTILVTGAAGFIGFHVSRRLLQDGFHVVGVDSLDPYYSVQLKQDRLTLLSDQSGFEFYHLDLADRTATSELFERSKFDAVIHLAAQAGVRYSLQNPQAYVQSNLIAFANVLEGCRTQEVGHLVFASSSSVYGANTRVPFATHHTADHPLSLYAATKKSNELMAHAYAHLYGIPCTGLRLFTVYGPWGRPDMAPFLFARAIFENQPINVYNGGDLYRDFTYIDDVVETVTRVLQRSPVPDANWSSDDPDPSSSAAPYRLYNVGNSSPVKVADFIAALEDAIGKKAIRNMLPMQPGDMHTTYADVSMLEAHICFRPAVPMREGVRRFIEWYRPYYGY